jgi:hypothetical protein
MVTDACYHCGNTGEVDEETDFHDRLMSVAYTLAYQAESEYRQAVNSDPDGDGYDLGGYENGLMPFDYFRTRVWDRQYSIAEELSKLDRTMQEVLVAWNEQPWEDRVSQAKPLPSPNGGKQADVSAIFGDDDIPF